MSRYPHLDFSNWSPEEVLSKMLEKDKQWGFVIIRCSYEDQAEWERFLSLIKQRVIHQIKSRDINLPDIEGPDIYENLALTIIEDEDTLADASISVTMNKFMKWIRNDGVETLQAMGELQDIDINSVEDEEVILNIPNIPRFLYYVYATKEVIKSYSNDSENFGIIGEDDPTGGTWVGGQNYLHVVSPGSVLAQARWTKADRDDESGEGNQEEEDDDDNDQEGNLSKKIRGATLVDLYLKLVDGLDHFYNDHDEGFWVIA